MTGGDEDEAQVLLEEFCHHRWARMAGEDELLARARERLFEADLPKYRTQYAGGLAERKEGLAGPLAALRGAGERGVPHLGMVLATDTWASVLAADALESMPSGPLRYRALVEALFLPGDFVPEAGERAARTIAEARRWALFERTAVEVREAGIELQSLYWTSLFGQGPVEEPLRSPSPELVRATLLLYDEGHHSALVAGVRFLLDPAVAGHEWVEQNLREGGLAKALETMRERPPRLRPVRTTGNV